jgi:hypothetical protein
LWHLERQRGVHMAEGQISPARYDSYTRLREDA